MTIIILYVLNIFTAAAALPPPPEPLTEPLFAVGAQVQTDPDTTPGQHPKQAEAIFGTVLAREARFGVWSYKIRANNGGQESPWVPETRVRAVSKSLYGGMLETRAFDAQDRLKEERQSNAKLKVKYKVLRVDNPVLAGEILRLEALIQRLDSKGLQLKASNKLLADDLRDSSATAIFSRADTPVGKNATAIRSRIADIEAEPIFHFHYSN